MTTADVALPKELRGLDDLALDLRWSWCHDLDKIWRRLNPELWASTRNPWLVLRSVGRSALDILAKDEGFTAAVRGCLRDHARTTRSSGWFQRTYSQAASLRVAYFSMEYGISEALPMYAGGLGVLAGDYLKAASDLGVPIVAVGLLYQQGYFRQVLDANGSQLEFYPPAVPADMPILPVQDRQGKRLRLSIALPERNVHVRAWHARVGRIPLYLLDTNDPENSPPDREVTSALYGGGPELRLQQELILGIGGWRLLEALDLDIDICHLNEGHAAFVVLERARALMEKDRIPFDVALAATRPGNIFTTHTAVAAGFDRYEPRLIEQYFGAYADQLGVALETLLALGQGPGDDAFLPARLALRGSGTVNGVSRRHGEVSRALFAGLFPQWPLREIPIGFVTNGVHTPSWDSPDADRVWTQICGKDRWREDLSAIEQRMANADAKDLWRMRLSNRARLVQFVRERLAEQLRQNGAPAAQIEAADHALDPNALTIGFARRFASYKRPLLLLHDERRLTRMLTNPDRPVQIVVAGKAHPSDVEGKAMVRSWAAFVRRDEVRGRAVFLSDYDLLLAEELVQGVDLWINTPKPPWEASGTSGMKVLVNGGLNLSELDGWWVEAYAPRFGWAMRANGDSPSDDVAAQVLYEKLETEIIPAFYARDAAHVPMAWVDRMRASMAELAPRFSTNRVIREYVQDFYSSALDAFQRRTADHCALARRLVAWQRSMRENWPELRFGEPHITATGASHQYEIRCYLGELSPAEVSVELYADGRGEAPSERHPLVQVTGSDIGSTLYRTVLTTNRDIGDYTPRAIPRHSDGIVPLEAAEIAWQR